MDNEPIVNEVKPRDRPQACTANAQLVLDSGLNWFAVKLLIESAKKCAVLEQVKALGIEYDGIRIIIEPVSEGNNAP